MDNGEDDDYAGSRRRADIHPDRNYFTIDWKNKLAICVIPSSNYASVGVSTIFFFFSALFPILKYIVMYGRPVISCQYNRQFEIKLKQEREPFFSEIEQFAGIL